MSEIRFGGITFRLCEGARAVAVMPYGEGPVAEYVIAGQNKLGRGGTHIPTMGGESLRFKEYRLNNDILEIVQESDFIRSTAVFRRYKDCGVMRAYQRVENITDNELVLRQVSSFVLYGGDGSSVSDLKKTYLYRFYNSWHCECQPRRISLFDAGLYSGNHASFRRIYSSNRGGWSTKEELPQAILEHRNGDFTMFQIESPNDWYWEIGESAKGTCFYAGGADAWEHDWEARLAPGDTYTTPATAVCSGHSLNGVVAEMTQYRRLMKSEYSADTALPVVFNGYMHLFWDSPTQEETRKMASVAASLGSDIYVIDCGWHNEENGDEIYPYVGQWKESKKRFPDGVKQTIDYIHSLGIKAGLWLEPEAVGQYCKEMISAYPDDAWFCMDGQPVIVGGRRFLDYRCPAVKAYMDSVVERIVREYGVDYLKFDYNQDCGSGTDARGDKPGRGLELATQAFFVWVKGLRKKYPDLIIEGCASGGLRLDFCSSAEWALVSSSDQTSYKKYPWIAANILSAVLPEQAGVWSYPVDSWTGGFRPTEEWVRTHVSDEEVAMNMVNAMLGRLHLASHVELLSERQKELVREGVDYIKKIAPAKKTAVPYFPNGFARFGDNSAASGIIAGDTLYLAVWNTGWKGCVTIALPEFMAAQCKVAYPLSLPTEFSFRDGKLTVVLPQKYSARFFELSFGLK